METEGNKLLFYDTALLCRVANLQKVGNPIKNIDNRNKFIKHYFYTANHSHANYSRPAFTNDQLTG